MINNFLPTPKGQSSYRGTYSIWYDGVCCYVGYTKIGLKDRLKLHRFIARASATAINRRDFGGDFHEFLRYAYQDDLHLTVEMHPYRTEQETMNALKPLYNVHIGRNKL